ncbi:MAG: hypothetical protein WC901_04560 [Candidatus Margulisiibacteriota bacterium]
MSKRLLVVLVSFLALLVTCSAASALLSVSVLASNMSLSSRSSSSPVSVTGVGARVELPILFFCETNVEAIMYNYQSGSYSCQIVPITLNLEFGIPTTPLYLGVGGGPTMISWSGSSSSPTNLLNYHAYLGYQRQFAPLSSYFLQAGYEVITMQSDTTLSNGISGLGFKAGLTFGI